MKKAGNTIAAIAAGLSVMLATVCAAGFIRQKITGELFFLFGYRPAVVLSGSMEPYIDTGAVAIIRKAEEHELKEQDVIFFMTAENVPVLHRYIGKDDSGNLITKGDANEKEDLEHIRPEQLKGRAVLWINWI